MVPVINTLMTHDSERPVHSQYPLAPPALTFHAALPSSL
jgi:hypothetical protein